MNNNEALISREKMPFKLGPPPKATNPNVSKSMKGNIAKGTKPELMLRKALWRSGFKGYRLNWHIPGRPDIAYPKSRLAIFVNGCYWHRCPICKPKMPKTNTEFWKKKFTRNKKRDELKNKRLKDLGWHTITVWECQLKRGIEKEVLRIKRALRNA